jgi:hypothetical protein
MATRLRTNAKQDSDKFWLSSAPSQQGVHVQTWMHDHRWLQIDVCDYEAPAERRWRVTIIDRQTHAAGTATGPAARKTFDAARATVGMPPAAGFSATKAA